MRKKVPMVPIVIAAIVVVIGAVILISSNAGTGSNNANNSSTGAKTYNVVIRGLSFIPTPIDITVGDTVIWTNNDTVSHTITSDAQSSDSQTAASGSSTELHSETLAPGQTYTHKFTTAGVYRYHCSIHTYMRGAVVVLVP